MNTVTGASQTNLQYFSSSSPEALAPGNLSTSQSSLNVVVHCGRRRSLAARRPQGPQAREGGFGLFPGVDYAAQEAYGTAGAPLNHLNAGSHNGGQLGVFVACEVAAVVAVVSNRSRRSADSGLTRRSPCGHPGRGGERVRRRAVTID